MATPQTIPSQEPLVSSTESYSENLLGPVTFNMSALNIQGKGAGKANIIAFNEPFIATVTLTFDQSPLTALLMCLGTDLTINFGFEGFGKAEDQDATATVTTVKDQFVYTVQFNSTPNLLKLNRGYYELAATATIGPITHNCGEHILGYGYIGEIRFQVY